MKYKIGDKVTHFTGINGMITGVFLDTNQYEFTYLDNNSDIKTIRLVECEIDGYMEDNNFGFNRK